MFKFFLIVFCCFSSFAFSQTRTKTSFNKDWKFYLGDDSTASQAQFNDASWRKLNLPHDWSIEGEFSEKHPTTFNQGALPAGIGWYRKTFSLPGTSKGKKVCVVFDGVYRNSEVWINGRFLGKRPNGYIGFEYDLTPYLKFYPEKNVIAVRVDNSFQPNSRWYTGSGIYRNVWLSEKNDLAIDERSVFVRAGDFSNNQASVIVKAMLLNSSLKRQSTAFIEYEVYDAGGKLVAKGSDDVAYFQIRDQEEFAYSFKISNPRLWSPSAPNLYRLVIKLLQKEKEVDRYETKFGFRYFNFDAQKGFSLNGKPMKILGVCMHHDLGALGAAVNKSAMRRQLKILKEMGCNAIRTAHNPPAPEFLDLCDEMGFLVMDEAFDMWKKRKNKYDYNIDFNDWHRKDLEDMVRRDRNHPSIFIWSIGNEIREQFDSNGTSITRELVQIVKELDTTRPVTCALTENVPEKNFIYQSGVLDVLGFNYKHADYSELPQRFPGQKFIATETASALASRGHYEMPSDSFRIWPPDSKSTTHGNADKTVSAYDNTFAYWGGTHEVTWKAVKKYDFMSGIFVWSGFDFLGEPVPYQWPARSSYYGIVDLAGFPKDVYYLYQSEWSKKPVLHLFPHWNWKPGQLIDVWAYYNNADEVELFLNGRSLGTRKKDTGNLHVMWRVPFEPGTLKAVSKENGGIVLSKEIKTAGIPAKIELIPDRKKIPVNGDELVFITVKITDAKGSLVPGASLPVSFSISGPGTIVAVDNGLQTSSEPFRASYRTSYNGMCLAVIKPTGKKGNIVLVAKNRELKGTSASIIAY